MQTVDCYSPRETAAETEVTPLLATGVDLGRSHTKWSQQTETTAYESILENFKKQIQGTNL